MDLHTDCQLILPTDKRNPSFSLYLTKDGQSIQVFYGFERFEVVPNDPEHMAFRMMVGRLYNAHIRTATLEEVFNLDRKTIRSWGIAILSRNPDILARAMLGRGAKQKRTAAIDRFVVRRRQELLGEGCPNYRDTLVREIEAYFEVKLSGETIRQIINELAGHSGENASAPGDPSSPAHEEPPTSDRQQFEKAPGEFGFSTPTPPVTQGAPGFTVDPAGDGPCLFTNSFPGTLPTQFLSVEKGETTCSSMEETTTDDLAENLTQSSAQAVEIDLPADAEIPTPSKCSPPNWLPEPGDTLLCDHVGALIFATALSSIGQATTPEEPLLAQWLGSILLGAVNVEQTKYLNWDDLEHMLASPVRFPSPQREQLTRLATPETIDAVLRWNAQQLGLPAGDTDLYYDPHTAHYTGMQSVLKGWCAATRWADRLINSDYIHTAQGHPIYFECTDNFDDLRARFLPLIGRLRTSLQWASERILTCVIDRAIYSNEVFTKVLADPAVHLVTWEKGYHPLGDEDWKILAAEHSQTFGSHVLTRLRNHSRDRRLYYFEYLWRPWKTNPEIRQILVRATNPRERTVQLSILTDDNQRPIEASVRLMFNRWVQENDFKYLNKHFGINQLTSYRSTPYEQLRDQLTDRQVPNLAYVGKAKIGQQLNRQQARQLLVADQAQRAEAGRQQEMEDIRCAIALRAEKQTANPAESPSLLEERKAIARINNASKRHEKYRRQRAEKIESLHREIEQNEEVKAEMEKEVSRIDQLIEQEMVRMDLRNKTLMDALKICARNVFYLLITPFRAAYNNYRDDHDYYRELTQSDGVLRWTGSVVEVHIVPRVNYSPKLQKIIKAHLEDLNATGLVLPDGSRRPLRLRLTSKEQISVRINDAP